MDFVFLTLKELKMYLSNTQIKIRDRCPLNLFTSDLPPLTSKTKLFLLLQV